MPATLWECLHPLSQRCVGQITPAASQQTALQGGSWECLVSVSAVRAAPPNQGLSGSASPQTEPDPGRAGGVGWCTKEQNYGQCWPITAVHSDPGKQRKLGLF